MRWDILADAGAYPHIGAFLPNLTAMMASGVYQIPKIDVRVRAVATNTTPIGAVRGAGRPEAAQALERAIDAFAADCGLDPAVVRRGNFIPPDAFPFSTATGASYDIGDYERALDLVLDTAGYDQLRADQAARRNNGSPRQLGIGLGSYVEITNGINETEFGSVEITGDGHAIVKTGSFSHGQGHETTFAQIASDRLGIPIEKITVVKGDTDAVAARDRDLRLKVDPDRRRGRRPGLRGGGRASQAARRRGARGEPRGHGARRSTGACSTSPARPSRR